MTSSTIAVHKGYSGEEHSLAAESTRSYSESWTRKLHGQTATLETKTTRPTKSSFIWRRNDHEPPHAIRPIPKRQSQLLHQKAERTRTALDQSTVMLTPHAPPPKRLVGVDKPSSSPSRIRPCYTEPETNQTG
ncbi:hypothetical protein DY000_02047074 [Brassica cretica]|uniref:TPX2 central domain-containing protein n=1 Tax=Brassica cretica TaxID=69181 RepID=A0ABQ7FAE9_BRACR|nr:hypothetical protein DY000_02047074 [Brassica cretica]